MHKVVALCSVAFVLMNVAFDEPGWFDSPGDGRTGVSLIVS